MPDATSDAYFATRPREARIGAWASEQSTELASRDELMARFDRFDAAYPGEEVPAAALGRLPDRADHDRVLAGRPIVCTTVPVRADPEGLDRPAAGPVADTVCAMDDERLRERIEDDMPRTIAELERLVRLPSRGYVDYDPAEVRASAEATRDVLRDAGVEDARLLELDGGHPAVFGHLPGPEGRPRSSCTRTTTCSPRDRSTSGTRRPSNPS